MEESDLAKIVFVLVLKLFSGAMFGLGFGTLFYMFTKKPTKKIKKTKYPPCKCQDVNQCSTWCRAKVLFTKIQKDGIV